MDCEVQSLEPSSTSPQRAKSLHLSLKERARMARHLEDPELSQSLKTWSTDHLLGLTARAALLQTTDLHLGLPKMDESKKISREKIGFSIMMKPSF
jgi:hypothetical protein